MIAIVCLVFTVVSCKPNWLKEPEPIKVDIKRIDDSLFDRQLLNINGAAYMRYLAHYPNIVTELTDGGKPIWNTNKIEDGSPMFSVNISHGNRVIITTHGDLDTMYKRTYLGWEKDTERYGGFKVEVVDQVEPNGETGDGHSPEPTHPTHSGEPTRRSADPVRPTDHSREPILGADEPLDNGQKGRKDLARVSPKEETDSAVFALTKFFYLMAIASIYSL